MAVAELTLRPVAERVTGAATLGRMILSASERGEDAALRRPTTDGYESISYRELGARARAIARGLIALGIERGDAVAILCSTRAEWTLCEAGGHCAGAVVVPVYDTNSPEECRHVLAHSQARAVFCENAAQVAKIAAVAEQCPSLEHVIAIDGEPSGAISLAELDRRGEDVDPDEIEQRVQAVSPEDLATLVYTSGTTGPPKGCALTHANFLAADRDVPRTARARRSPAGHLHVPAARARARARRADGRPRRRRNARLLARRSQARSLDEVAETQPTHFVAVPRIYEKLHTGVISAVEGRGPHARVLFAWALEVGRRARRAERAGKPLGWLARRRLRLADAVGLAKVRALFGPRLKLALVGAAPIDHELLEFFDACGVLVLEGYGMTESCATATLNPAGAPRFGTVGRALPNSEVMVSEDGEVLLRGPQVFAGYHRDAAATRCDVLGRLAAHRRHSGRSRTTAT